MRSIPSARKRWAIVLAALAAAIALVMSLEGLLDEPLRAWAEKAMNAQLDGYTVKLARWNTHLWRLALELDGLTVTQDAHPESPVANLAAMQFTISWRALLHLRLLGVLTIERPHLRINLAQLEQEAKSETPLKDKGWQGAVQAIYPLKLEEVLIHDGSLLYLSANPDAQPIRMTRIEFSARDIRNVNSASGTYPSPVHLDASLFETGTIRFEGAADFLAKPAAALKGEMRIVRVPLDRLGPEARSVQLQMKGGFLSAHGTFESMPESTAVLLKEVLLEEWKADYVTSEATKAAEKKHVEAVAKAAKSADNAPKTLLRIDRLRILDSEFGFVNRSSEPRYRLFLSDFHLEMDNLSNQFRDGEAKFKATGSFMGSGRTAFRGGFRPDGNGADFDVHLEMRDAKLASLNNLLQAYGGFDVSKGSFSLFSEIKVKDQRIEGYVKPLVKNVTIYDKRQDRDKSLLGKTWEHVVEVFAYLLKNGDSKKVATDARISGKLDDPKASNFRVIVALVRNGFLDAILPGFQKPSKSAIPKSADTPPKSRHKTPNPDP